MEFGRAVRAGLDGVSVSGFGVGRIAFPISGSSGVLSDSARHGWTGRAGIVGFRIAFSGVLSDSARHGWTGRAGIVGFRIVRCRTGGKTTRCKGYVPRNQSTSNPSL